MRQGVAGWRAILQGMAYDFSEPFLFFACLIDSFSACCCIDDR